MKSNCGRYWIVYNGECFNYSALREELSKQGVVFQTSSDTEVLLQGLILEGESFIERVNGFFAFGFYDTVTEEILLGRDRLGIKPLYIYQSGDGLWAGPATLGVAAGAAPRAGANLAGARRAPSPL